ncbi:MAG: hypothetical protein PWP76_340 [Candidatus Diapherotrites archaeon]|nr:hypothetical protein [Candidatus Diapherotrites archaeon]MDN5366711.1 hypothetical protein [Candidatus Diapherotrites archaeon]
MRVESVEYDDGTVYVHTESDTLEYPYEPAILFDPRILPYLSEPPSGVEHAYSFEVRGDVDYLIDLQREISRMTNAYLFIEPERQFLLDKGISIGTEIVDGMPSLRLPPLSSWRDALTFLLRTDHGPVPRVFLENVYFQHRVAVDLSHVRRVRVPSEALRVVLDLNIDPTTLSFKGGRLLPASRVRVSVDIPFNFPSTDPVLRERFEGLVPVGRSGVLPLADAELLGLDYDVVVPVFSSERPGVLQRAVGRLFGIFNHMLRRIRVRGSTIEEYALRSSSSEVISAYAYIEAISRIVLSLAPFLASTNVLTPVGRENFLTGWEMYRRDPNTYKRLYADNPVCSRVSRGLEYFLLALSSLPLELPHWLRYPRA